MKPAVKVEEAHRRFTVRRARSIEYYSLQEENPRRWVYYFRTIQEPIFVELFHPEGNATKKYILDLSKSNRESLNVYLRSAMKCTSLGQLAQDLSEAEKECGILDRMGKDYSEMYLGDDKQSKKMDEWRASVVAGIKYLEKTIEYRKNVISSVPTEWIDALPSRIKF